MDNEIQISGIDNSDVFSGVIVAIDPSKSLVRIRFDVLETENEPDFEDYHWDSENIAWISKPIVPNSIQETLGCAVEVKIDDKFNDQEKYLGLVVSYDVGKQLIAIKFLTDGIEDDIEIHHWLSNKITWRNDLSLIEYYNNRPASINEAIGYTVGKSIVNCIFIIIFS